MEHIQEITLFILLTVGLFCPSLCVAFHLPPGRVPWEEPHSPWRLMLSGSVLWFLAYLLLLWLSYCRSSLVWPDVWLEIWDRTKEEKVGKTHGTVHIPTATNNQECLDRDKSQAGRSSGSQGQALRAGLVLPAGGSCCQELSESLEIFGSPSPSLLS